MSFHHMHKSGVVLPWHRGNSGVACSPFVHADPNLMSSLQTLGANRFCHLLGKGVIFQRVA